MQRLAAQIAGILVTASVVLGTDLDVLLAVSLGIFAGAIAMIVVAAADTGLAARERRSRHR